MELGKFLSLCAMLLGVMATLFLSRVLLASPETILRGLTHYSPMGWPSAQIISDRASQKADTVASVILVGLAFGMQLLSLCSKPSISMPGTPTRAVLLAVVLVAVMSVVTHQISLGTKAAFATELKMLCARDRLRQQVEANACPLYSDVQALASQYFNLTKKGDESDADFVRRFADYVHYYLPADADLSKFR